LYIEKLIEKNVFGMINVGIGKSILVKDFLTNILGKRQVKLVFKKNNKFSDRSYSFNIKKLQNLTGIKIKKKILNSCFNDLKVMINNSYD
jgi:hypothetical protein